jgi:hypothetical protein
MRFSPVFSGAAKPFCGFSTHTHKNAVATAGTTDGR